MAYTQEELDAALSKIVRTSVRFGYDSLGTRKVGTSFNDLQDAAAGVFVSFPNAPYYVVRLGADRLVDYIATEAAFLGEFISTVRAVGRNVSPVRKLSSLTNAKIALDALATATGQRSGAFVDIESIPAFQRFDQNTQRFLDVDGKNIRSGGAVVPTPQQARSQLASLAQDLRALHEELLRRATALQESIDDFEALDLPERLSRDIVSNARDVLEGRVEELEGLSTEEQLAALRDVVLDVMTARAAVRGFGSLTPQGLFVPVTGVVSPYASTTLPANRAVLEADLVGPYAIYPGQDKLTVELDGSDVLLLQLVHSFVPFIQVPARGPFEILAGANEFSIAVTGSSPFTVVLTPGGTQNPWNIVDDINAAVTTEPIEAVLDFIPLKTTQAVDLDVTGSAGDIDFVLPVSVGTWASLGIVAGDYVLVRDATSTMDGGLFSIDSFPDAQTAQCTIVRAGALTDELDKVVELGTDAGTVWTVQVPNSSAQAALDGGWSLSLTDVEEGTLSNIGLVSGSELFARKTTAQDLATAINTSPTTSILGVPRVTAQATFVGDYATLAHTNPSDVEEMTLYAFRGRGDVSPVAGSTGTVDMAETPVGVSLGDVLVVREHTTLGEVGKFGTITGVAGTLLTVDYTPDPAPVADTDVLVDVGPDRTASVGRILVVDEDSPQDGRYGLKALSAAANGLDFVLDRIVFANAGPGGQPYLLSAAQVGADRLDLLSADTTLSTAVEVQAGADDASGEFYSSVPKAVVGTTPYMLLPETPSNLEAGDQVELHNTSPAAPDVTREILDVLSGDVIELVDPIDVTQAALTFTVGTQVPFGRIRKQVKQNFNVLEAAIGAWLELPDNDLLTYFRELDAYVNALVVSANPTAVQVNDAAMHLQSLLTTINALATDLGVYVAGRVDQVDNLITAYEQKGADRAKAILLEGRFSDFFNLTQDGLSYAGEVQRLVKDVSRLDLPVRKDTRHTLEAVVENTEVASWDDTDFEYTEEDIDPADRVEVPAEGDLSLNIPIP